MRFLASIFILFLPGLFLAQTFDFALKVTDNKKNALEDVQVVIDDKTSLRTNKKGQVNLQLSKEGTHKAMVFQLGYEQVTFTFTSDNWSINKVIRLNPITTNLNTVKVLPNSETEESLFGITKLKRIEGTSIYAGKKSEVISVNNVSGNKAAANAREVFAKVSGLNIWESDCAGLQLSIGGRGLSPHRTSNFNTRQNGYDISADALGYPETYYMPPLDAVDKIELVRGAGSLQYGTQFGGMLNFKLKEGDKDKPISLETYQTVGSFNFLNSYTAIGGSFGKFRYYTFYQFRRSDCFRPNSEINLHTVGGLFNYDFSSTSSLSLNVTHLNYLAQQPGGLTDAQFEDDPRQSNRERNWFGVNWNVFSLGFEKKFENNDKFKIQTFGLIASRSSLGVLDPPNRGDLLGNRNLIAGDFANQGVETKYLKRLNGKLKGISVLFGSRLYRGNTMSEQGAASSGYDADFSFLEPGNPSQSSYRFPSYNAALFSEAIIPIGEKIKLIPGLRGEFISTNSEGSFSIDNYHPLTGLLLFENDSTEAKSYNRSFLLKGLGVLYTLTESHEVYANFSENYRAINFNDVRIANPNFRIDPNIKDESGFNSDVGIRGNFSNKIFYDLSVFYLSYSDRIGVVLQSDSTNFSLFRYRSNIAKSRNYGLESFVQANISRFFSGWSKNLVFNVFGNFALTNSNYFDANFRGIEGNKVEYVPLLNLKIGVDLKWKKLSMNYQFTYVSEQFTDATNAEATSSAIIGVIPQYWVSDVSMQYALTKLSFKAGVNNLLNKYYFNQRATGYPGPGILPATGRNIYVTLGLKL